MKATTIRPTGQNILVEPIEAKEETKTNSGFVLVKKDENTSSSKGKILRLGEGIRLTDGRLLPFSVKEGDIVLYRDYAGHDIEIDGVKYKIISEQDIFAVAEEK